MSVRALERTLMDGSLDSVLDTLVEGLTPAESAQLRRHANASRTALQGCPHPLSLFVPVDTPVRVRVLHALALSALGAPGVTVLYYSTRRDCEILRARIRARHGCTLVLSSPGYVLVRAGQEGGLSRVYFSPDQVAPRPDDDIVVSLVLADAPESRHEVGEWYRAKIPTVVVAENSEFEKQLNLVS